MNFALPTGADNSAPEQPMIQFIASVIGCLVFVRSMAVVERSQVTACAQFTGSGSFGVAQPISSFVVESRTSTPTATSTNGWMVIGKDDYNTDSSWSGIWGGLYCRTRASITRTASRQTIESRIWNSGLRGSRRDVALKTWWSSLGKCYESTADEWIGRQLLAYLQVAA